ncbi:MAG TPA: hypothetical protein VH419_11145 [Nocardioidaceae bacterium]|jgi:hypothetical protein
MGLGLGRIVLVMFIIAVLVALMSYARGAVHHHGDDIGSMSSIHAAADLRG